MPDTLREQFDACLKHHLPHFNQRFYDPIVEELAQINEAGAPRKGAPSRVVALEKILDDFSFQIEGESILVIPHASPMIQRFMDRLMAWADHHPDA